MDVLKYLKELLDERKRIDRVIQQMESLLAGEPGAAPGQAPAISRRGRKPGMTDQERRAISERMQKYWAMRRGRRNGIEGEGGAGASSS